MSLQRPGLQNLSHLSLASSNRRYEESRVEKFHLEPSPMAADDNTRRPYEPTPLRPSHEFPRPVELASAGTRESLPSIRSIFSEHRADPVRLSFHERSPSFPPPLQELRRVPSPGDRHGWDLAYPRPSSSHYSQDSQVAGSPKSEVPAPLLRPYLRGPNSPAYPDPRFSPQETHRPQPTAAAVWTPRTEHREYFSARDTGSSFKIQAETSQQLPPPTAYGKESESRASYATISPATPRFSTPPASTNAAEPLTTKDGLGPKIWTGTQFLPRFVRSAEVPGEGMCYFYDDGTHCKTHIDGEAVNAHWGVTKAGKPRKRLAIACITCREKKIKCDPDYPRCIQCEKFGRTCRFQNA